METTMNSLSTLMSPTPVTVAPEAYLDEAIGLLEQHGFRHLPVVSEGRVVGILSDRNLRLATSMWPSRERLRDRHGGAIPGPKLVSEVMTSPVFCLSPGDEPARAAFEMVSKEIGAIPVVEETQAGGHVVVGIVTETNLLRAFVELSQKSRGASDDLARYHMRSPLTCVTPDLRVEDALDVMDYRVGHVGVREERGLVGILSQRDLLVGIARETIEDQKAQAEGRLPEPPASVASLMTTEVVTVAPGTSLSECAKLLVNNRVSALPVLEDGQPVGILTQRNILEYYVRIATR